MENLHFSRDSYAHVAVKISLMLLWATVSFGACFFARELQFFFASWPAPYWLAAQGTLLTFVFIVVFYAWFANRLDAASGFAADDVPSTRKDGGT